MPKIYNDILRKKFTKKGEIPTDVCIQSQNSRFCRALAAELSAVGYSVCETFAPDALLCLWDIDTAAGEPPQNAILFSCDGEKLRRAGKAAAAFERPFDLDEFLCAVGAALSRAPEGETVRYDRKTRTLCGARACARLSEKEARLFDLLLSHDVLRRADADALFAGGSAESNVVDVYIHYLRKKLRRVSSLELLVAARGEGYELRREVFSIL